MEGHFRHAAIEIKSFHRIPVGVVPYREGLADARDAIAQADIAVVSTDITKLCKTSMFFRDDKIRGDVIR
jgi:hypothetical protein